MNHLIRAGILVLAVLLLVFVVLRLMPVPTVWEYYGFYRGRNDVQEWINWPMQYADPVQCNYCHEDKHRIWQESKHSTVSCENCHGPGQAHVEEKASLTMDTSREFCGFCHAGLISRPSNFPQVDMEEMGGQEECVTCHDPHDPRAGMPPQVPHTLKEYTDCELCHGQHEPWVMIPPQVPHTLEQYTDCLSCHGPQEFRGATLPHIPHTLEGRTDCLLCHKAGRINPLPEDHTGRTSATCLNCHTRM